MASETQVLPEAETLPRSEDLPPRLNSLKGNGLTGSVRLRTSSMPTLQEYFSKTRSDDGCKSSLKTIRPYIKREALLCICMLLFLDFKSIFPAHTHTYTSLSALSRYPPRYI